MALKQGTTSKAALQFLAEARLLFASLLALFLLGAFAAQADTIGFPTNPPMAPGQSAAISCAEAAVSNPAPPFSEQELQIMVAVCVSESNGNARSVGHVPGSSNYDYGLWQISSNNNQDQIDGCNRMMTQTNGFAGIYNANCNAWAAYNIMTKAKRDDPNNRYANDADPGCPADAWGPFHPWYGFLGGPTYDKDGNVTGYQKCPYAAHMTEAKDAIQIVRSQTAPLTVVMPCMLISGFFAGPCGASFDFFNPNFFSPPLFSDPAIVAGTLGYTSSSAISYNAIIDPISGMIQEVLAGAGTFIPVQVEPRPQHHIVSAPTSLSHPLPVSTVFNTTGGDLYWDPGVVDLEWIPAAAPDGGVLYINRIGHGFKSAVQAASTNLSTFTIQDKDTTNGASDRGLGMMPGTSPSIAERPGLPSYRSHWNGYGVPQGYPCCDIPGHHEVAFQANTTQLWVVGDDLSVNTGLGMMPGTSPSIGVRTDGHVKVAFQANTSNLWVYQSRYNNGGGQDLGLGMAPNTSPSLAMVDDENVLIAFQANTNELWITGTINGTNWTVNTGLIMRPGTSPSLALNDGGLTVAYQGQNTDLMTYDPYIGVTDWGLGMADGTSPAIAYMTRADTGDQGMKIAFQANTNQLWIVGLADGLPTDWQYPMMPGTSPSLTAFGEGGFGFAFQSNSGTSWIGGSSGGAWAQDTGLAIGAGTSPALSAEVVWYPVTGAGSGYGGGRNANTANLLHMTPVVYTTPTDGGGGGGGGGSCDPACLQ